MDPIREAFSKIKEDMDSLKDEIIALKSEINTLKQQNIAVQNSNTIQTTPPYNPLQNTPNTSTPTHNQTDKYPSEPLKPLNLSISIGNRGVPTDKQTNRQTDKQTDKTPKSSYFKQDLSEFEKATEILDSLDSIKKEIRLKFKRLTNQEMSVFSELYALEEQNIGEITYKLIANNLNLSESSIRDYVTKLVNKGIPILKIRQNNKKIVLKISPDLQKIATLSTIMRLREI